MVRLFPKVYRVARVAPNGSSRGCAVGCSRLALAWGGDTFGRPALEQNESGTSPFSWRGIYEAIFPRRRILTGFCRPVPAAVLADPKRVKAAAEKPRDDQPEDAFGTRSLRCLSACRNQVPAGTGADGSRMVGLNDQIKGGGERAAEGRFIVLAADLYGGKVANNPNDAQTYMNSVDPQAAEEPWRPGSTIFGA